LTIKKLPDELPTGRKPRLEPDPERGMPAIN
jgi:hypothetical protein